jgi:hypothetical protein
MLVAAAGMAAHTVAQERVGTVVVGLANILILEMIQPLPGPPTQVEEGEVACLLKQVQVAPGLSFCVTRLLHTAGHIHSE